MGADKKPKKKLIPARTLSGFQDLLPDEALAFHDALDKITSVYRRYGYGPIDAPCIYLYETLAGEAGDIDKQLYRWTQGSKDVALRFDLTVPLARYVAANEQKLTFPFKRYHWGKVWRGESVQQKKGRYREFYQLDFDIVGTESPSADLEAVLVIHDAMLSLGLEKFTI
ncbi:MAG: ATP phosphoribosyltransferase regulatory subunit, partial [Planctomycetota bacterium]|nr:ATP phosphoribosyltransferase regulatory subunit [Planctomycetota bacterium]